MVVSKHKLPKSRLNQGGRDFTSVIQQAKVPNVAKKIQIHTEKTIQRDWVYKATKIVLTDVIRA